MYKVLASTRLDMNEGWVWLTNEDFVQRSVVKIRNNTNKKVIFCEYLRIDQNFKQEYNQHPRISIQDNEDAVVMNAWYRERLGGIETNEYHDLQIMEANYSWGKFQACIGHPQIIVRLATWLALISVFLGFSSVVLAVIF